MNTNSSRSACPTDASLSRLAATGSRLAFCAAACWIALGVESIVRPQQENYRDLLWMIPFALTAITFLFLHATRRSQSELVERAGFYLVMTAAFGRCKVLCLAVRGGR